MSLHDFTRCCCPVGDADLVQHRLRRRWRYAAGFVPEKSEVTLGESIYLAFNLTNTGSNTILMSVGGEANGICQVHTESEHLMPADMKSPIRMPTFIGSAEG